MATSCIYCGSSTYGRPCMFSPTNTHVHMDEPGKCIYCGSTTVGGGCMFNPYGSMHIRGPEFLNRSAVQTEKAAVLTYILNIASSLVLEGQKYASPLDRLYKRVAGIIASASEPLLEALKLQETPSYGNLSKPELIKTVELKNKIKNQLESLTDTLNDASLCLSPEMVEKVLVDAIMDVDVRKVKH